MAKTAQTPLNFSNTNSILSTAPKVNTQSFGNFGNSIKQNPSITASNALQNAGIKSSFADMKALQNPNTQATQKLSLAQKNKQIGQDRLNSILNAQSAEDLQKPKYKVGAGFGNYRAQKAAYNEQAQKFGIQQNLTPEQKAEKGRNAAGWALAGIDSAVNIANAGMSYANMKKQWEMANKAWNASEQQRQIENERYNKREDERLKARDDARNAQNAVFGSREWHDANANQNGESGEGDSNQNGEQEAQDKTAFERE
ncbi:hypothetical protein [Helicobacter sp. T3_23-1059]